MSNAKLSRISDTLRSWHWTHFNCRPIVSWTESIFIVACFTPSIIGRQQKRIFLASKLIRKKLIYSFGECSFRLLVITFRFFSFAGAGCSGPTSLNCTTVKTKEPMGSSSARQICVCSFCDCLRWWARRNCASRSRSSRRNRWWRIVSQLCCCSIVNAADQ